MASAFDMTTLDDEHRMNAYVVVGDLDPVRITIHDDSTINEVRSAIANKLKIPIESQESLTCTNNNGEVCDIELTKSDEDDNKKLNDYDPQIVNNATFTLDVSNDFDIDDIGNEQKPKKVTRSSVTDDNNNNNNNNNDENELMRPTSIQGEREREKKRAKEQKQQRRQQQRQQQQQQQSTRTNPPQQQAPRRPGNGAYRPSEQEIALYHKIQKHSRTHCRLLFVLMEIQLILLIIYWGGLDMIMYLIAIMFALAGFRGCRKLHPLWILSFLLWLILEILLICLFIIAGIVESHESIYGSTGAYIALLTFELILDCIWAYWYFKFLRMVLAMDYRFRAWGELQMKQTVVFC